MSDPAQLDQLCINTMRTLSIDAVQQAQSGHPGTPMGAAPAVYCLWQRFLRYDPDAPNWPNRDRFVLSVGHASTLLYSVLHLCGVKAMNPTYEHSDQFAVTLDDIKSFRLAGSRCTGHPEYGWTSGVETTTGPLGQGVGTSVGMAIAQRWLAATYNRPGYELFDHNVYALCGDGDMMEGISSEAASLAGHLKLSNLCWIYDDNHITIEGSTTLTFTEDVAARFRGYGWNVTRVSDANDLEMLSRGYQTFLDTPDRPTLIIVQSHIGYGAPHKQDTREAHGEPLGPAEVRLAKEFYGWDPDAHFYVPDGVPAHFRAQCGRRGATLRAAWEEMRAAYGQQYPDLADQIDRMQRRDLPEGWDSALPSFPADAKGMATRDASGQGAERHRREGAVAAGRRGGSRAIDQNALALRLRRRVPGARRGRRLPRTQCPLRHSRACDVRDRQWTESVEAAALCREFPDLHRLLPRRAAAQCDDGSPGDLHLDPRLDQHG